MDQFIPTRSEGLAALERFVPRAGRQYADQRNFDHGPNDRSNISCLSPYLRYRLITEVEVIEAVLARHSFAAAEKFIQEVCWRTYWKGWLEQRPAIWDRYTDDALVLRASVGSDYQSAVDGRTGVDCFDAWVIELKNYGYLHNHARMWFASIWVFTLKLPWQLGAEFFYHHLLDGDPASNTLSWRWVAGLQTIGKTYLARADNIAQYTNGRFHTSGLAISAFALHEAPIDAPQDFARGSDVPTGRYGLLITKEDLHPESLVGERDEIAAIATVANRNDQSDQVNAFIAGALADAGARASHAFQASHHYLDTLDPSIIADWADEHDLKVIATGYAPIGQTRTQLNIIKVALASRGITLVSIQRRWDSDAWPYARKGFFPFSEKIPKLIAR